MSTEDQIRQYDGNAGQWASVVKGEKEHLALEIANLFALYAVKNDRPTSVDFGAKDGVMAMMAVEQIERQTGYFLRPALYDISEKSLEEARKNFGDRGILITSDYNALPKNNDLVLATHVAQAFETEKSLREDYFRANFNLLAPGGRFISTGNHPLTLTELHSTYQCRFPYGAERDGEKIKTKLYSVDAEEPFLTVDDYYWSLSTLQRAAEAAGFVLTGQTNIPDIKVPFKRGYSPAYVALVFVKPEADI